ncbi:MAG: cytochrome P450, partial [Myxococcales bacterium]|nr:cytochrome P450 [Myxococcales bacterium]
MTAAFHLDYDAMPGPRGLPLLGSFPALARRGPFEFFSDCFRRYGDAFRVRMGGSRELALFAHPDALQRVLQSNVDNYQKGVSYDPVRELMGNGLVTSSGSFWARQRRLTQTVFRLADIARYLPVMARCVNAMHRRWERAATPLDVREEMTRLTQHIVGLTLFGLDLSDSASESAKAVDHALVHVVSRVNQGLAPPLWLPTPGNRRYFRSLRLLDEIVYSIITRTREGQLDVGDDTPTLLRALMAAEDEDTGERMSDQQLRDETITLYIAGHETTAGLLTWALELLTRHPEVLGRVREEVSAAALDEAAPTLAQLDALPYTRMVIDETLRMRPSAWVLTRTATAEDTLRGVRVPAGAVVATGIYFAHHHPDFWDLPHEFRPERFEPAAVRARHKYAYLPFLRGPRICIGN